MKEEARKDVQRCFRVLQARFAIIKNPARFWKEEDLHVIMTLCIIIHNMIIENERDYDAGVIDNSAVVTAAMREREMWNRTLARFL